MFFVDDKTTLDCHLSKVTQGLNDKAEMCSQVWMTSNLMILIINCFITYLIIDAAIAYNNKTYKS